MMILKLLQAFSFDLQVGLVFFVVFLSTVWYLKRNGLSNLPPGPPCLPIVGSLPWIGRKHTASFPKLREKYGDVFTIYVFSRPVVVLASYEAIKEALVENADSFSDRPEFFITKVIESKGVTFTNGQLWRDSRRFCLRTLRDFGIGKLSLEGKVMEEVKRCVEEFLKQNSQAFDPKFIIGQCVANIICSIIFGQRFEYNDPTFLEFLKSLDDVLKYSSTIQLADFFPFLKYVPGDPICYKVIISYFHSTNHFVDERIKQHRESFDPGHIRSFIDAFIKEESETVHHGSDGIFAENQLRRMVMDLFEAGSETTTKTLQWALLFLMRHEDVQVKVQNEIDTVIGTSRPPTMSDRVSMPYTEATIMEIQRHADIGPGALPHAVSKDFTFRGYQIPAGTMVIPHLTSALQDTEAFKAASEFDPANFLDGNKKVTKPEQFIPFSTGRRVCLGESLARMELFLFLTSLLQRFTFRPPEGKTVPTSERFEGLVIGPGPFKCRALERI